MAGRVSGGIETGLRFVHDGPMKVLTLLELRNHFSRLMRRVEAGEELLVSRYGVPAARIVPIGRGARRTVGLDVGEYTVPADFNSITTTVAHSTALESKSSDPDGGSCQ
jgi:prevent-host-death family protein